MSDEDNVRKSPRKGQTKTRPRSKKECQGYEDYVWVKAVIRDGNRIRKGHCRRIR